MKTQQVKKIEFLAKAKKILKRVLKLHMWLNFLPRKNEKKLPHF